MYTAAQTIAVISRRKAGAFQHIGLQLPDGRVVHCAPGKGEHLSSVEEFADGQDVTIIREVPPGDHNATIARIVAALQSPRPYDVFSNNCEMFANRMTGQKAESAQLQGALILMGMAALVGMAAAR